MLACWHCGKGIRNNGPMVRTSPPNLVAILGLDFPKSYHVRCYWRAEKVAANALMTTSPKS